MGRFSMKDQENFMREFSNDIICLVLSVKTTDKELRENIKKSLPICLKKSTGFCLTISDFDDDPRELWQIPEAISFMKRLYEFGFLSLLEVSTTLPELIRKAYLDKGIDKLPGMGAIEVWSSIKGLINVDLSRSQIQEFVKDLHKSKIVAEEIFSGKIPDSSIKHSSRNSHA